MLSHLELRAPMRGAALSDTAAVNLLAMPLARM